MEVVKPRISEWFNGSRAAQRKCTMEQILDRARQYIEDYKIRDMSKDLLDQSRHADEELDIARLGAPGVPGRHDLFITQRELHDCVDSIVEQNLSCIQRQLDNINEPNARKLICIPGGMGECRYFVDCVTRRFKDRNTNIMGRVLDQEVACVRGALLRFANSEVDFVPP
ncbi:MAG: hypothetical protein Q9162_007467, partial [Coniocarpon cinnabarinum]